MQVEKVGSGVSGSCHDPIIAASDVVRWRKSVIESDTFTMCLTHREHQASLKFSDAEFMQNRSPVGCGPSGKT
jgi:hypothetical protein